MSFEGLKTRELVSREAQRTNDAIAMVDEKLNHLVIHQEAQMDDHVRERFLKSLQYPDFNQRRNQIDSAHVDTLKWIFVGDDENESGEDHDSRNISDKVSETDSESESSTVSSSEASYLEDEDEDQGFFYKIKWDSFSNWLRSTDSIYWISGKPGSGKTTLVKYVVTHPRTTMYLDFWSPGCEIASHYFWRPGFPMQKSLEGLFCSLLYQLLSNNNTRLGEVMSFVPDPKDSFTDWSSTELRSALSRALSLCKKGVCLFLDGVDEIDPEDGTKDGIPELLELVSELSQTGNIKLCLASRPEPYILEMRLSMHPRLRLQDLNYADLMAYTKDRVKYPQTKKSKEYHDLAHSLVDRAEGVFLWLLLAIKSINEGFSYHDNVETLTERMKRLPKGLHRLYEDMWQRVGEESPAKYRQTAALYFKLIIATQGATRPVKMPFHYTDEVNVFDLTLATTSISGSLLDALDEPSKLISADVLQQKCEEVEQKLKIYCMGLIEVRPRTNSIREVFPTLSWFGRTCDRARHIVTSKGLQFIHRTASDFLTDTESGRKILDHDMSSDYTLQVRLMEAKLARLVLFTYRRKMDEWCYQLQQFRARWQGTEEWVLKDWHRLIRICEKLANSGRLFMGSRFSATPCGGINFLRAVAWHNIDDEFIISRLKSGNLTTEDKSAILLNLSDSAYCPANIGNLESRFRTMLEFLREGADPNWQISEELHLCGWATPRTPWQNCLYSFLRENSASSAYVTIPKNFTFMAEVLVGFLSEGAELDSMVNMCLEGDEAKSRWYIRSNGWHGDPEMGIFASIPAYLIVGTLADSIPLYSRSYKESCLGSCAVLKQKCADHSSSKQCRVLGKLGDESLPTEGEYVLLETTNEKQIELGNRLFESLKQQVLSTKSSHQPGMCKAVLNDESWFVRARGVESGLIKELEGLELLKATDESPGIEEWVRKYIHKTSHLGETT